MYASASLWHEFYRRLHAKARSLTDPATGRVRARLVHTVSCVVCRSSASRVMAEVDGFTYAECTNCGFVYLNPQLRPEALVEAYNDADVRQFFFRELLLPHVERDQEAEFVPRLRELRTMAGQDRPRLLDIGCAAGKFLELAVREGFSGEGLELNQEYIGYIEAHRKLTVRSVLLRDAGYPDDSFDVVTLWDVLEHVPDPADLLSACAGVLRPGGVIAFTTINHACLNRRLLGSRWRYWMPPDHVCSFTPSVIRTLLGNAGFTDVTIVHQTMFEVIADGMFPWLSSPSGWSVLRRFRKVLFYTAATAYQKILNAAGSGDILVVFARRSG